MFDPKKPFATCGMGPRTLYQQDGVYYNPSTKEPVDLSAFGKPKTPTATSLTCTFCGAERATPELFKEHLLAAHRDQVPDLSAPKEVEPEKPAVKPKGKGK